MTTETLLPATQAPVQITTSDGRAGSARVDAVQGDRLTLAGVDLPVSQAGESVMLRWPAGARGRYAQPGTVVAMPGSGRSVVQLQATPQLEQLRRFVRGGGGETIRIRRTGAGNAAQYGGFVQDISEQGVRARCTGLRAESGESVWAQVYLEDQMIEVMGTVLSTTPLLDGSRLDVVVVFEPVEAVAQVIRRYVLRRQVRARQTAEGRGDAP